ncbi:permease [Prauserella sp. PE36]|uniref:permease n=1 Tax=Prauserella sp. PE36 TaxID=1504709 RepID=UPI000DE44CC0|nr:permease [Prauserella sp. PE36]RBM17955.1 permease [Prauserella sp. PE36]
MADPDDLAARVAALETDVRDLAERVRHNEREAAAARVLAGGADRGVAELSGEIEAFRDQNRRALTALRDGVADLSERLETGLAELRARLEATAAGQERLAGLLTKLLERQGDEPTVGG